MILYLIYKSLDLYKAEAANAIEKKIISETNDEIANGASWFNDARTLKIAASK